MQPPETEPTTAPSSASAMIEPIGRGDDPQVRTTVESSARRPACRQSRRVRSTMTSRFSMLFPAFRGALFAWPLAWLLVCLFVRSLVGLPADPKLLHEAGH